MKEKSSTETTEKFINVTNSMTEIKIEVASLKTEVKNNKERNSDEHKDLKNAVERLEITITEALKEHMRESKDIFANKWVELLVKAIGVAVLGLIIATVWTNIFN